MLSRKALGLTLVIPGVFIIFMILVFPIFFSFYFSLFDSTFFTTGTYVGIKNFINVLMSKTVLESIVRALFVSISAAGITLVIGFVIALIANKIESGLSYVIQIIAMIPWITSMVVAGLLWKWIFAGELGLFNYFVSLFGVKAIQPLQGRATALGSLVFVISWRTIGYSMVMILAGLKTVPSELLEASLVDGANALQRLIHIIIPIIRTPLLISTIVVTLSNMNNVTIPLVLTGGGPSNATNTVSLELYRLGFVYNNYSQSCALAIIVFSVNVILIYVYMRSIKWRI